MARVAHLAALLVLLSCAPALAAPLSVRVDSFSVTGSTYDDVPGGQLTLPGGPQVSNWLLLVSGRLSASAIDEFSTVARVLVDGAERGVGSGSNQLPSSPAAWQFFDLVRVQSFPRYIRVQLRTATGGSATIQGLRIIAVMLPPELEPQLVDAPALWTTPPTGWATVAQLALPPLVGEDYVVAVTANAREAPNTCSINLRVSTGAGFWPVADDPPAPANTHFLNSRSAWFSYFTLRPLSAPAGVTLTLEAQGNVSGTCSAGSPPGQVQHARLLAFKARGAFLPYASLASAFVQTVSTAPRPIHFLTVPASNQGPRDLLIIQSLVAGTATDAGTPRALVQFELNGVPLASSEHAYAGAGTRLSYGHSELLRQSDAVTVQTSIATTDGTYTTAAKDSSIVAFALPVDEAPDAGAADGGDDAGTLEELPVLQLGVGCDCSAGPGAMAALLLAAAGLLAPRHRRS